MDIQFAQKQGFFALRSRCSVQGGFQVDFCPNLTFLFPWAPSLLGSNFDTHIR